VAERPTSCSFTSTILGFRELSCYGAGPFPGLATQRIDAFAGEAFSLTSYCAEAQCTPTRSALLTGRGTHSLPIGAPGGVGLVAWERTLARSAIPSRTCWRSSVARPWSERERLTLEVRRDRDTEYLRRRDGLHPRRGRGRHAVLPLLNHSPMHMPVIPREEFAGRTGQDQRATGASPASCAGPAATHRAGQQRHHARHRPVRHAPSRRRHQRPQGPCHRCVDQLDRLCGRDTTSRREGCISWMGPEIYGVRWRDFTNSCSWPALHERLATPASSTSSPTHGRANRSASRTCTPGPPPTSTGSSSAARLTRPLGHPAAQGACGSFFEPRVTTGAEGGGTTGPMSPSGASSRSTITGA
jgi:hypothetical protein